MLTIKQKYIVMVRKQTLICVSLIMIFCCNNFNLIVAQPEIEVIPNYKNDRIYKSVEKLLHKELAEGKINSLLYYNSLVFFQELCETPVRDFSDDEVINILKLSDDFRIANLLRNKLEEKLSEYKYNQPNGYVMKIEMLTKMQQFVDEKLAWISKSNFVHYDVQETSKKILKGIHIFHDNDNFLFVGNRDRDYTGGFRIELMTDFLKMRLFNYFRNRKDFLSYQSLLIGGEGYTPYIRFTKDEIESRGHQYEINPATQYFTDPSLASIQHYLSCNQEKSDRPFASFQYIGRGKYRLHHTGILRSESFFKIGKIGGKVGENVQEIIHKDFSTKSQRVLNWENQIANGGRFAINIEHKLDFSLFSQSSLFFNSEKNGMIAKMNFMKHINIHAPVEFAFGTVSTYAGAGLGISNKPFSKTSGINDLGTKKIEILTNPKPPKCIILRKIGNGFCKAWKNTLMNGYLNIEYRYRYVFHNSMLEGIGFIDKFEDDPLDDENITRYHLDEEDVNRNLHTLQFQLGVKANKVMIYYKQLRFLSKEFEVKHVNQDFKEFTTPKWYGYGTFGVSFLL